MPYSNKKKELAYRRAWNKRPEVKARSAAKRADRLLRYKYGISLEEKLQMLASQGGKCAICNTTEPPHTWCVDHVHGTSLIRAILCDGCNTAIGMMKENPEALRAAATYLESFYAILASHHVKQ